MTEQERLKFFQTRSQFLIDLLVGSFIPFSLGIFFASAIFLSAYMDFAHLITAAIEKNCGVK